MRTPVQEAFLSIIRYEIAGTPLPEGFSVPDMDTLLELSERQDVTHMVCDALLKNGIPCGNNILTSRYYAAIWRVEQMDHEMACMSDLFEKHGIDFIPLKGSVLRGLYPQRWMRTSSDIDILLRAEQEKEAEELLVKELGYEYDTKHEYIHHGTLFSPVNHVHVEPHWTLFHDTHSRSSCFEVFDKIWDRAVPDPAGSGHRYALSDADAYTYLVAHMEKHFHQSGGCSIKGLLDLWLMDRIPDADIEGRKRMIREVELSRFEDRIKDLIYCWMEGRNAENEQLEQFVLQGTLFGTARSITEMQAARKGRLGYMASRIFLPLSQMKLLYPVLDKHPLLLPVMWIRRLGKVAGKNDRRRIEEQIKTTIDADKEDLRRLRELGDYLGLE